MYTSLASIGYIQFQLYIIKHFYSLKNKEISFSHIVNTTTNPKFELAQSITIQSMLNAKQKSTSNVELLHTSFENEYQSIDGFSYAGDLKKSAKDVKRFNINRRLPLIKEIFDNGCLAATNQYFIYTNIDISLMPDFYNQIAQLINQGYDCIIVNRKNIDDSKYRTIEQIEDMYADSGEPHVGMDCFVFKKRYSISNRITGIISWSKKCRCWYLH